MKAMRICFLLSFFSYKLKPRNFFLVKRSIQRFFLLYLLGALNNSTRAKQHKDLSKEKVMVCPYFWVYIYIQNL